MFVAFELQIGLKAEVNGLRVDHLAYEERQILKSQPLLKAFKEQTRDNLNDVKKNHIIAISLDGEKEIDGEGTTPIALERLCLNNKRLNIWADQGKAVILDGPFELDPSWRYLVDSMTLTVDEHIFGISVGLFVYFGPHMAQISALFLGYGHAEGISLIKLRVNFLTMESIPILSPMCDGVVLIAWGEPCYLKKYTVKDVTWAELKESDYHGMKLAFNQFEELS
eukprot:14345698-Ditylum_brightwellii.AAC.1